MGSGQVTLLQRFWEHVDKAQDGCWNWTGWLRSTGYGRFYEGKRSWLAHRFSYTVFVGPIPSGLNIDHLCRNRSCVNPAHLEPVTQQENLKRGIGTYPATVASVKAKRARTNCQHGHEYTPKNTRLTKAGTRVCRACHRDYERKYAARRKQLVDTPTAIQ